MKKLLVAPVVLFCLMCLACSPPPPEIEVIRQPVTVNYSSPYGNDPVGVLIGTIPGDTRQWLLYRRTSDQNCTFYQLSGGASYMVESIWAIGGTGNDWGYVPGPPSVDQGINVWCNDYQRYFHFDGPNQYRPDNSSALITLDLSGGNDTIVCNGIGDMECRGNAGNDWISSINPGARIYGDSGDDVVVHYATGSRVVVSGGYDNDCISAPLPRPGAYDCGPGTDTSTSTLGSNCETLVPKCPGT